MAKLQWRSMHAEAPVCRCAADRVTVDAGRRFENAPARDCFLVLSRGLLLRSNPRVKIFSTVDRYAQEHLAVLRPAILRTLAEKDARAMRIHPHAVRVVRNQVGLAA